MMHLDDSHERLKKARQQEKNVWDRDSMEDSESAPANWLNCEEDGVPELEVYVLVRHNRGTWSDSSDQEGVNYVWVKRMLDPFFGANLNNSKNYIWKPFGPDSFFGQEIRHWCYVSRVTK